jgi:hypothetical protein
MNLLKRLQAVFTPRTARDSSPSAAVRNFLLSVEGAGGFLFDGDDLLKRWAAEAREAERQGYFASESGFSVGSRLTPKGERFLREFRETGAAMLTGQPARL